MAKKKSFLNSFTFKALCVLAGLIVLGLIYNFIVNINNDSDKSEDEQVEEERVKASKDTIDIIGDYLWPSSRPKKMETASSKDGTTANSDVESSTQKVQTSAPKAQPVTESHTDPIPVPARDITSTASESNTKQASTVERVEAPKVERIE